MNKNNDVFLHLGYLINKCDRAKTKCIACTWSCVYYPLHTNEHLMSSKISTINMDLIFKIWSMPSPKLLWLITQNMNHVILRVLGYLAPSVHVQLMHYNGAHGEVQLLSLIMTRPRPTIGIVSHVTLSCRVIPQQERTGSARRKFTQALFQVFQWLFFVLVS